MNVFDIAMQMEKEGAEFYRDLASKATTKGLKTIFTMLAEDEVKHQNTFLALKNGSVPMMVASQLTDNAETVFKGFKKKDFLAESKHVDLYERALEVELKSIEFYSEQLQEIDSKEIRKAVEAIITEERRHYDLIDDIVMMLDRPNSWVENAEFGVREEY